TGGDASKTPVFDYYQPILDRMPFGAMPANFNASAQDLAASQIEAKTKAEQEAIAKKIKMSVVNITPAGATAIGFTDLSVNPPVNHYLKVGDSSAGWLVVSADYSSGSAVIAKEGVSVELSLQDSSAAAAVAPAAETLENGKPTMASQRNGLAATRGNAGNTKRTFAKGTFPRISAPGLTQSPRQESGAALDGAAGQNKPASGSYSDRLRERATQKTREQLAAEAEMREQLEKLARETAAKEIQRREEEALLAAQEEAELQQQWVEQQQAAETMTEQAPAPAVLQEGNLE
ncbi:MAG: hypothetical protein PHU80_09455, partial [Kiritimatiellae bacterium]|nr:hypothetical protein [Kiritimatiellia bacterium]